MISKHKKIKILLAEDSAVQRSLLIEILNTDSEIELLSVAVNGIDVIEKLKVVKPDVILMDLHMPKMNGIEAIQHIMATNPLPILAISASNSLDEMVNSYHALEAGAVAFAEKPVNTHHPKYEFLCNYLLTTVKLMSEVKVVHRRKDTAKQTEEKNKTLIKIPAPTIKEIELIAIGVSTGGPIVLQKILSLLPAKFPPIIIVQHIAPGFVEGLAQWLTEVTKHRIELAKDGLLPERNHIYLAPDNYHTGISDNRRFFLKSDDQPNKICPSVDFLFTSVAKSFKDNIIGIILTGMGNDGAAGLKKMRDNGAITIAQNKESSLIFGMPNQAIVLGAATYILSPEEIIETISLLI